MVDTLLFAAVSGIKGKDLINKDEAADAFCPTKAALALAALLHNSRHDEVTALTTDASNIGIGATLVQRGLWWLLAFFSQEFPSAKSHYSTLKMLGSSQL